MVTPTLPWICTALSATSKQRSETNSLQAAASMRMSAPRSASTAVCRIMLLQAHRAAAMSASMCCMAWKRAMGPPNCWRVRA
ncbi:hypothetical protein D3C71_2000580 [compost metagenome]